jgi:hypothetical protein
MLVLLVVILLGSAARGPAGPSSAKRFIDVTLRSGLPVTGKTSGCTALDLDRDGRMDLLLGRHASLPNAYLCRPGLRFERTRGFWPPGMIEDHHATAVADLDRDGFADLYLVAGAHRGHGEGPNQLWLRSSAGATERAAALRVQDRFGRGRGALFADLAGDPQLDLLVLNFRSPLRLFVAQTGGGFLDQPQRLPGHDPVDEELLARTPPPADTLFGPRVREQYLVEVFPADFDENGAIDLLGVGRPPLVLYLGTGRGTWRRAPELLPPAVYVPGPAGGVWGDFDGDGRLDLYLVYGDGVGDPAFPQRHNRLLLGVTPRADGIQGARAARDGPAFRESAAVSGAELDGIGTAAVAADLDNDGHLDLLVVRREDASHGRASVALRNRGDGTFEDVSRAWGLERALPGVSQGALAFDWDGDGDLDLLFLQGGHGDATGPGGARLLRNDLAPRGWIELALSGGPGSNPEAFGTRVALYAGGARQVRQHWPAQVAGSSMPLPLHFGLGDAATVDSIEIRWPSGRAQAVGPLGAGRIWEIPEGEEPFAAEPHQR